VEQFSFDSTLIELWPFTDYARGDAISARASSRPARSASPFGPELELQLANFDFFFLNFLCD
jgi:hypothetical protein